MINKTKTTDILLQIAADMNPALTNPIDIKLGGEAPLFGSGGALDSMALVQFIVEVEAAVEDHFGHNIVLANERAMSQRRSPFLTIQSLANYIDELLTEVLKTA